MSFHFHITISHNDYHQQRNLRTRHIVSAKAAETDQIIAHAGSCLCTREQPTNDPSMPYAARIAASQCAGTLLSGESQLGIDADL